MDKTISYFDKLTKAFEPHRQDAEAYPSIDNDHKTDEQLIRNFQNILDIKPRSSLLPNFFTMPIQLREGTIDVFCSCFSVLSEYS